MNRPDATVVRVDRSIESGLAPERFPSGLKLPFVGCAASQVIVVLAFIVPLTFALFTNHAWEDYYITLRSSRNLVEGHGLVFNPGERVHTFTSPLGVLLPALCLRVTAGQEAAALWMFRVISAGLLAAAAWLVTRRADSLRLGPVGWWVLFGLILADAKLTDFSINGQETALLVFFTVLLWSGLEVPVEPAAWRIGVACGGLMWARPDGFVLAGAIIVPHLLLRRRADGSSRSHWPALWRGALIGGAIYLPWFIWAWWYYGTPVPHTVLAKSLVTPPVHLRDFLLLPWRTLTGKSMLMDLFLPTYWVYGDWPTYLRYFGQLLSVVAAFAWLVPALPAAGRRLSLAVFLGMFYICVIILFPWYLPPWTVLAALSIAVTVDHAYGRARQVAHRWMAAALRVGAALMVAIQGGVFLASAWEMRVQQRLVENDVRRDIGEWLHAQAKPGDTVFLEPLGYIGYYSRLKTYDYPGLSSPEVVAAIRTGARRLTEVIARLRPTWLVLRPFEIADSRLPQNAVLRDYAFIRRWNIRPQLDALRFLPGRGWLEHDAEFLVYRLMPGAAEPRSEGAWRRRTDGPARTARANTPPAAAPYLDPAALTRDQVADRLFELGQLRFGRLGPCLQGRTPDAEVGYSSLIFRLTDKDVRRTLAAPVTRQ